MNPKRKILEFIQKAYKSQSEDSEPSEKVEMASEDRAAVRELFDGMSTGTARIVIEEELEEGAKVDSLENKGRYYVARIVRPDGSAIRRLLVDKQTGNVQFAGR